MDTLGAWLRQAREAQGSSLEEAESATRIRARFLEALEEGDYAAFTGSEVQVRGFLRIYARFLDLPPDEVVARYKAEVHGVEPATPAAPEEKQPTGPAQAATRPMGRPPSIPVSTARPRRLGPESLLVAGVVLIVILAAVAVGGYLMTRGAGEEAALTPTPAPSAQAEPPTTVSEAPTRAAIPPTFPASPQGDVTLALKATEHVWVRLKVDGQTVFEGMLDRDQVETWSGQEVIVVETGNGAGLQVTVNGQPQGTMCGRNQVCTRGWGPTGEVLVAGP